jgi:branched-subunit amino acid aminotransferase/4-amino-4-deoxychorismate lyase
MYRLDPEGWREFRPDAEALTDRGLWLGDGAFETMRVEGGALRHGPLHADSLAAACDALDLARPDWTTVEHGIAELAGAGSHVAKVIVTRGPAARGLDPVPDLSPQVFLQLSDRPKPPHAIRLACVPLQRSSSSLAARYKTLSYADNLAARREAVSKGADMAVLSTEGGLLSGGDSANLFWISDGRVFTPSNDCGIRKGVMRQLVLEWLARKDVPLAEVEAAPGELDAAEAVFMTNAVIGVVPVSEIDGQSLPVDDPLLARLLSAGL